jgi:ABC-type multidrug transport system fused ATPase/permease subunit
MTTTKSNLGGIPRLYRTLWRHAHGLRARWLIALAMLLAAQVARLVIPFLFGQAVNALQTGTDVHGVVDAAKYLGVMFGAAVLSWTLHGPARVMERNVGLVAKSRLADSLYARAVSLPLSFHERKHSGDTIHRIQKTTSALFQFAQHQFVYVQNFVSVVGPIVALLAISPNTGLVAVLGYAIIAIVLVRFDRVMVELVREENAAERKYTSALVDCIGNISTVIALRLREPTRAMIGKRFDDVEKPLKKNIAVNEMKWASIDLLNNFMRTGLVALYAWLAWRATGSILVGTAVMVYQYVQQIGAVVGSMASHWTELVRQQTDIACADDLFAVEVKATTTSIDSAWQRIDIDALTFAHEDEATLVDLSLSLSRGSRVALVGASGSGKSTLLRVLAGLYEADRVRIRVDGNATNALHLGDIATLVPQDPEIFESSVRHNLTLGLDVDDAELMSACENAGFAPVLAELDAGLETVVAERGASLSGGQKQRLALARGLLASKQSSLVLLDEPTSSIDPVTEAKIYDALLSALPGACVVSAIHRLHLLSRFDVVVLLSDGRVVDVGSVDELRSRQPMFSAMWRGYLAEAGGAIAA